MISFYLKKTKVSIHLFFISLITIFLLFDKTTIGALSLLCSILHESGHILTLFLLKNPPKELSLDLTGIRLSKSSMPYNQELIVLFAGSFVNFSLAFITWFFTKSFDSIFFIINISIGVLNCLPSKGFDGGKILNIILGRFFNLSTAEKIVDFIEFCLILGIISLCVFFYLNGVVNISVIILCVYLLLTYR